MKKTIIQIVASMIFVIVAAGFFYDSGVLLLRYGDRRQAVLHLAPAVSFALLYFRCAYKIGRKEKGTALESGKIWSQKQRETAGNILCYGVFGTGISLYLCRFLDKISLIVLFLACTAVTCVLCGVCIFWMRHGEEMPEIDYRRMLLSLTKKLEAKGCLCYSETTKSFTRDMINGKVKRCGWSFCVGTLWVMAMAVAFLRDGIGMIFLQAVCAGFLLFLGIRGLYFAGVSKKLMRALKERKSQEVLTALVLYYEISDSNFQKLPHIVQSYAVAALCDQEAYEEALALIGTIRWPPKWESYYAQWQMICLEGVQDEQRMRKLLENKGVRGRKEKGRRKEEGIAKDTQNRTLGEK